VAGTNAEGTKLHRWSEKRVVHGIDPDNHVPMVKTIICPKERSRSHIKKSSERSGEGLWGILSPIHGINNANAIHPGGSCENNSKTIANINNRYPALLMV
jgi:hypothetical protein